MVALRVADAAAAEEALGAVVLNALKPEAITPAGGRPWTMSYAPAQPEQLTCGRLDGVSRAKLAAAQPDSDVDADPHRHGGGRRHRVSRELGGFADRSRRKSAVGRGPGHDIAVEVHDLRLRGARVV